MTEVFCDILSQTRCSQLMTWTLQTAGNN